MTESNDDENLPVIAEQTRYEKIVEEWDNLRTLWQAMIMFAVALFILAVLGNLVPDAANNQRVSANTVITDVSSQNGDMQLTIYTETPQAITIRHNGDNIRRDIGERSVGEFGDITAERGGMETITFDARGQVEVCDESACETVRT